MRSSFCGTALRRLLQLRARIQPLLGPLSLQRFPLPCRYILRSVEAQAVGYIEEWILCFYDRVVFGHTGGLWFLHIQWWLSNDETYEN